MESDGRGDLPADLDDDLDALYSGPLDEFVTARNALAGRLRKAGDREAAERVKKLPKPPVSGSPATSTRPGSAASPASPPRPRSPSGVATSSPSAASRRPRRRSPRRRAR